MSHITCKLSKMSGKEVSMWLLYLEALRTGAVLLCSTSLVRKSLATLVGIGVSDRVRASVNISTICIYQIIVRVTMSSFTSKGDEMPAHICNMGTRCDMNSDRWVTQQSACHVAYKPELSIPQKQSLHCPVQRSWHHRCPCVPLLGCEEGPQTCKSQAQVELCTSKFLHACSVCTHLLQPPGTLMPCGCLKVCASLQTSIYHDVPTNDACTTDQYGQANQSCKCPWQ